MTWERKSPPGVLRRAPENVFADWRDTSELTPPKPYFQGSWRQLGTVTCAIVDRLARQWRGVGHG